MTTVPRFPPPAAPVETGHQVQQLLSLLSMAEEEKKKTTAAPVLVPLTADQVQRVLSLVTMEEEEEKEKRKKSVDFDYSALFQVLQRSEADTLFNLRMVSKQWHNLILDPYFAISHLSYAAAASPGFLLQSQTPIYGSYKLGYKLGFLHLRGGKIVMRDLGIDLPEPIIASCDGLVLFRNYPKGGDYSVGNLFSRKGKILPPQNYNNSSVEKVLGFTYVKETGEYKIVCLMCKKNYSYCVMIFTLGSNTWTQVNEPERASHFWEEFAEDEEDDIADRWEEFMFAHEDEDIADRSATPVCVNNFLHSLLYNYDFERVLFTIDANNGSCHKNELPLRRVDQRFCLQHVNSLISIKSL